MLEAGDRRSEIRGRRAEVGGRNRLPDLLRYDWLIFQRRRGTAALPRLDLARLFVPDGGFRSLETHFSIDPVVGFDGADGASPSIAFIGVSIVYHRRTSISPWNGQSSALAARPAQTGFCRTYSHLSP